MVNSPERTSGSNGGGSGAIAVTAHRTASRAEHDRERERLRADAEVDKVCRRACMHGRRCCGSGSASAVAPHHQCGGSRDLGEPARRPLTRRRGGRGRPPRGDRGRRLSSSRVGCHGLAAGNGEERQLEQQAEEKLSLGGD